MISEMLLIANMYALSFVGTPYIWGHRDCSWFVGEILKSMGYLRSSERLSSQQMFSRFSNSKDWTFSIKPSIGCLTFYGKSKTNIEHVAYCLNDYQLIESGGGDQTTINEHEAFLRDAKVRVRKFSSYRSDVVAILKPTL